MLNMVSHKLDLYALLHGDSSKFTGDCDLVFTNPYAPLPKQLQNKPMLICDFTERKAIAEERCGTTLETVSEWYNGKNSIWSGNVKNINVDLSDLMPDPPGWFPEELVYRLLRVYGKPGFIVWDGFMGRGTVGKVALRMGMKFIGIDKILQRVEMAAGYVEE